MRVVLPVLAVLLALSLAASAAGGQDDNTLTGTIDFIGAQTSGRAVQYFFLTLKEYPGKYFMISKETAGKCGLYDRAAPGGVNRQLLNSFEGRRAEVRVEPDKGNPKWYIVRKIRLQQNK